MAKHSGAAAERKNFSEGRRAARQAARAKFGDKPLPINPATGKRWHGTGRSPTSGILSPILPAQSKLPPVSLEGRWMSRRERAAAMRERMARFAPIYNAGWMLRDSYFGPTQRRQQNVMRFVAVLLAELRGAEDFEALLYAVADALTCSPHGVLWEG